jgi:DNA-binding XRE family transcriptional regulator
MRKKATQDYNLQVINPDLAKEWNLKKNGTLTPEDVAPHSGKKVWWICDRKHEWVATVNTRSKGHGCPYCARQKFIDTSAEKSLKKANLINDAAPRGVIRKVGTTSSGNILVEMSPHEWRRIALGKGLPNDLSAEMVKYRRQHGLTQGELAEKIGISRTRLQEIERGIVRNFTYRTYERIISTIS